MSKRTLPLSQQLCFALYSANNLMGRIYRSKLSELNITYPQYLVLLALWERDGQAVGELCKALDLESSTLTPLLKRMETSGFVSRQRSSVDERSVSVTLTEKGKVLEEKAYEVGICVAEAADGDKANIEELRLQLIELAVRLQKAI